MIHCQIVYRRVISRAVNSAFHAKRTRKQIVTQIETPVSRRIRVLGKADVIAELLYEEFTYL